MVIKQDTEVIKMEQNSINENITKIIESLSIINNKMRTISQNENLWVGEKADAFYESIVNFFDKTEDGESVFKRLETEKVDIYKFLDDVILDTRTVDESQADNLSVN